MAGFKGHGTTLTYSVVDAGAYTGSILYVRDIEAPTLTYDAISTLHNGTAGAIDTFIPGVGNPGECSFTVIFQDNEVAELYSSKGILKDWRLTLPDNSYYDFEGFISSIGATVPMNEVVECNITITVSGQITLTQPGS